MVGAAPRAHSARLRQFVQSRFDSETDKIRPGQDEVAAAGPAFHNRTPRNFTEEEIILSPCRVPLLEDEFDFLLQKLVRIQNPSIAFLVGSRASRFLRFAFHNERRDMPFTVTF